MEVTVRAGEMSHKGKGVPFEWRTGVGLVDHDDVQAAFDELSGEGAVKVAQLEVRVDDTTVAVREIDLTAGPNDAPFPEWGTNFGCDATYTTSGGVEARPDFHAVSVPVGQSVDTPFSTELNPLGGSGDGETVPVTLSSASTSGDEFALIDESLTPEQPGLYVSERIYEGEVFDLFFDEGAMFGPEGEGFERMNLAAPRHTVAAALERLAQAHGR